MSRPPGPRLVALRGLPCGEWLFMALRDHESINEVQRDMLRSAKRLGFTETEFGYIKARHVVAAPAATVIIIAPATTESDAGLARLAKRITSMLSLIEKEMQRLNINYVKLTGQTKDRETPIEKFQNEEVPLFLISLKAGGVGLNLTAADTVIHYDPWWNPAAEAQATDRAHRIGQDKAVFVYKLITEGTVEEKILELQDRKRDMANGIYNKGAAKSPLWTAEDIDGLFKPLA